MKQFRVLTSGLHYNIYILQGTYLKNIYLFKVNNTKSTRRQCEISSNFAINVPEGRP